jgi:hypothetical protein
MYRYMPVFSFLTGLAGSQLILHPWGLTARAILVVIVIVLAITAGATVRS